MCGLTGSSFSMDRSGWSLRQSPPATFSILLSCSKSTQQEQDRSLKSNWKVGVYIVVGFILAIVLAWLVTMLITQFVTSSMNDDLPSQGNLLGKWYVMSQYGDFIDCPFSSIEFPAVDGGDMKILCYKSNSYLDMVTPIDKKTWASVVHTDPNGKTSYGVSRKT
jgi:hypothetical protein